MSARLGIAQASHRPIHTADEVEWMNHAACHGLPDHYFFPPPKARLSPEVRRICGNCKVRRDCLTFALNYGEWWGIWGGTTEKERRELAEKIVRAVPACGTPAAYQRHIRDGETPCAACRDAKNATKRVWYATNAAKVSEQRRTSRFPS